jgi:hypothetical protein
VFPPRLTLKAVDKAVIAAELATVDKLEAEALIEAMGARVAGKRIDEDGSYHGICKTPL